MLIGSDPKRLSCGLVKEGLDAEVDVARNAVHLSTSLGGDVAAAIAAVLHHLELLELEHGLADDGTAGSGEVSLAGTPVGAVGATIPLLERTDTGPLAEVHLAEDRRGADVEPVLVVGGELLDGASLHDVVVLGHVELGLTLQEIGTGLNEFISWNILDGNATRDILCTVIGDPH